MREGGATAAAGELTGLPEPTWRLLARRGLPTFAAEGIVPIVLFYAGNRLWGLAGGIALATATSAFVLAWQSRRGREGALARLTLVFVVVQAIVGLASRSATVYLAQPVVLSAGWGVAYLVSARTRRPLISLFANAWYPFPPEFRAGEPYRREFAMQSVVWGIFCLVRAAVRLWALLASGVGGFVVASFLTGAPPFFLLVAWGVWHARRRFTRLAASG